MRHFVGYGGDFYYHDWHATRQNATSLLLQKGSHDIDMIHWLTGPLHQARGGLRQPRLLRRRQAQRPDLPRPAPSTRPAPRSSTARAIQCCFRQEVDVEDNKVMIMELDGGIKASYLQCHFTPDYHRNYTFIGTEGPHGELRARDEGVGEDARARRRWRELADRTYDVKPARRRARRRRPGHLPRISWTWCLDGKEPLAHAVWPGRMSVAAGLRRASRCATAACRWTCPRRQPGWGEG